MDPATIAMLASQGSEIFGGGGGSGGGGLFGSVASSMGLGAGGGESEGMPGDMSSKGYFTAGNVTIQPADKTILIALLIGGGLLAYLLLGKR